MKSTWIVCVCNVLMGMGCSGGGESGIHAFNVNQSIQVGNAMTLAVNNVLGGVTVTGEAGRSSVDMIPTVHQGDPNAGEIVMVNQNNEVAIDVVQTSAV